MKQAKMICADGQKLKTSTKSNTPFREEAMPEVTKEQSERIADMAFESVFHEELNL